MKDLGVPALPGDFFDFMNQTDDSTKNSLTVPDLNDNFTGSSGTPNDNFGFGNGSQVTNRLFGSGSSVKGKGRDQLPGGGNVTHSTMSRMWVAALNHVTRITDSFTVGTNISWQRQISPMVPVRHVWLKSSRPSTTRACSSLTIT